MTSDIVRDSYRRPWYLPSAHLETFIPYRNYRIYRLPYERERLELQDGDFLDLDWVRSGNDRLLVMCHAYEGNSRDYFVERSAKYFSDRAYDILAWNYRSCGGELNRLPKTYDIASTDDLDTIVKYARKLNYQKVTLVGFSLGGLLVLNYLSKPVQIAVDSAAVYSTPLDLLDFSVQLERKINFMYHRAFLQKLKRKLLKKAVQFSDIYDRRIIASSVSLLGLHKYLIVQVLGYSSFENYCRRYSPVNFLDRLTTPLLLINALNDPILGQSVYPAFDENSIIQTHYTRHGGHVGFSLSGTDHSWLERRTELFLKDQ